MKNAMEQNMQKRGRKPLGPTAKSAAQRKQDQRARTAERIATLEASDLSLSDCLTVLSDIKWRESEVGNSAWRQIGKLLKYS